jgi:hypothetical protein
VTDVAKWLEEKVAALPAPPVGLAREDYPADTYSDGKVELAFDFLPRMNPPTESSSIVAFVQPSRGGAKPPVGCGIV